MKVAVHNRHSKPVMLPGGMLPPGGVRTCDLDKKTMEQFEAIEYLEIHKVVKKKAVKKKVKKDGGI